MSARDERQPAQTSDTQPTPQQPDAGQPSFQGGVGGAESNTGPYAGSQTYGDAGDQLGYGSEPVPADTDEPADPALTDEFATWRRTGGKR